MEEQRTKVEDRAALVYARDLLKEDFGVAESLKHVKKAFGKSVNHIEHIMFTALYIHIIESYNGEENTSLWFEPYSAGGWDLMQNSALILGKKR